MSASPLGNCPIQRLNSDVLWRIFDINADIFNDRRALHTTLTTSGVCHDWRALLLSSSALWAHVMNLDHRLWNTVEGSREMIRRTGTALTWMRTILHRRMDIIEMNWKRIEKFEVYIQPSEEDHWTVLRRPAPYLKSFSIRFKPAYHKFKDLMPSLFAGSAPMLQHFRLNGCRLDFTPMPWLQQLSSLEFITELTVSKILGVLFSSTNLTFLQLEIKTEYSNTATLPVVSLPKLVHLHLDVFDKLARGTLLLKYMSIPHSCAVIFSAWRIQRKEIDKRSTFGGIIRALPTCAQHCFAHHPPRQLRVVITPSSFTFVAAHNSGEPIFKFHINTASQYISHTFASNSLTKLLREFSLPGLSKVTVFVFRITAVPDRVPGLTPFIASLPSVNFISTEKLSLRHLRAYFPQNGEDTASRVVFPELKTLRLTPFVPSWSSRCKFDNPRDPVSKYVLRRISRGQPISVIEFAEETFDTLPNMAFLRKANGVKVLWRQDGVPLVQEYICGTNTPRMVVSV